MFTKGWKDKWEFYLRMVENIHDLLVNYSSSTHTSDASIITILHVLTIFKFNVNNECYFKTLIGLDLNWLSSNFER